MKKRVHIKVHGHVQGVFFRANAVKQANALSITGWVKNTKDCVEIIAEGEETNLKQLISWCNQGPATARVDNLNVEWQECKNEFKTFSLSSSQNQ